MIKEAMAILRKTFGRSLPTVGAIDNKHVSANDAIPRIPPRVMVSQQINHVKSQSRLKGEATTSAAHSLKKVPVNPPSCPKCRGRMWDNIAYADWGNGLNRDGSKKPVFTCKDQECGYSVWAEFYQNQASLGCDRSNLEDNSNHNNKEYVSVIDAIPQTPPKTAAPQQIDHSKSPSRLRGEARTSSTYNLLNVPAEPPFCLKCGGKMWDSIAYADWGNGINPDGSKKPVFSCRDEKCGYSIRAAEYQNEASLDSDNSTLEVNPIHNLQQESLMESYNSGNLHDEEITHTEKQNPLIITAPQQAQSAPSVQTGDSKKSQYRLNGETQTGYNPEDVPTYLLPCPQGEGELLDDIAAIFAGTYQEGSLPEETPSHNLKPPMTSSQQPAFDMKSLAHVSQVVDLEFLAMQVWGMEAWIEGLREKAEVVIGKNDYLLATSDELYKLQNILEVIRPRLNIEKPYHIEKDNLKSRAREITTSALGEEFEYIFNTEGEIAEEITLSPMPTHFHIPQVKELEWRDYQKKQSEIAGRHLKKDITEFITRCQ